MRAMVHAREEGGPFTTLWDFCERVDAHADQQARAREPRQVRRRSTRPARRAARCSRRSSAAAASGQKAQADALAGQASIFDLGSSGEDEPQRHHPAVIGPRAGEEGAARVREGDARPVPHRPPAGRGRRSAAPPRRPAAARPSQPPRARDRLGRRPDRLAARDDLAQRRSDGLRAPRRRHDAGRGRRLRQGLRRLPRAPRRGRDRDRQGPRRSPRRGGDEATRRSRSRRSRPFRPAARCGCASTARVAGPAFVEELTRIISSFPGEASVVMEVATDEGERVLRLGPGLQGEPEGGLLQRGARPRRRGAARLTAPARWLARPHNWGLAPHVRGQAPIVRLKRNPPSASGVVATMRA